MLSHVWNLQCRPCICLELFYRTWFLHTLCLHCEIPIRVRGFDLWLIFEQDLDLDGTAFLMGGLDSITVLMKDFDGSVKFSKILKDIRQPWDQWSLSTGIALFCFCACVCFPYSNLQAELCFLLCQSSEPAPISWGIPFTFEWQGSWLMLVG